MNREYLSSREVLLTLSTTLSEIVQVWRQEERAGKNVTVRRVMCCKCALIRISFRQRRQELQEVRGDIRRSPRLQERYSRERSEGPTLLTVAHVVTSRPGLSGYLRQRELERQNDSILNESGQTVPLYFDLGQDDTESRHSGRK